MMTIPMDNSSAPPTRERVQYLLNKNKELERGLRKAAQAKIPSDPNAWLQMRENYEAIILEDHDFSESNEIEYGLWQLHYKRIEEFRSHINSASASAGSVTTHGGRGVARPDRIKKIRSVFKSFLSEATGFYHDLILKIRAKYGLPLGYFSEGPENQISLAKDEKKSAEMKKGLISCHRCLIYLGDLARYKGLYGEGDSVSRDYAAASSYYTQAASIWPSSGNPHHQLAILASYSGDDLVAVYRYFRSLAVDCPFSTARDNLIIVFEKNRQSYSQLPGDVKINSVKRVSGRGRGRGETKLLGKDVKAETTPVKVALSIPETYKNLCVRFVRLNGILFTRTSLETFGEVFSLALGDLQDLLSSGSEEELNFGSDAVENGLFIVRLISILIFMVHNVNKESEGQSYAEILQRSVLLQNAFTAAFEFVGHVLKRCIQLQDISSSYLLPAVLVFIEWLACHPDIATGNDIEDKQATARSFFWTQCISLWNRLILSGMVFVDGDEDESCFSDMSRYDEGETGNRLALWEDFELRGFLPLVPAQLILDFSRKLSFDGGNKEKRARMQRILAAGRALTNVVRVDQQTIYFDAKLKKFVVGIEPPRSEHSTIAAALDVTVSNGMKHAMPAIEKMGNIGAARSMERLYIEGEEEDEVIVFKPTVAEKHSDVNLQKSVSHEVLNPITDSFKDDWADYAGALSAPQLPVAGLNANSQLPISFGNTISQPMQHIDPNTSKWVVEQQSSLADGIRSLTVGGNGFISKSELQHGLNVSQPVAFSLPFSSYENLKTISNFSGLTRLSEAAAAPEYDSIVPSGINANGATMKPSNMPTNSRKNPVSRPVRHFGPPPGFNPVPAKQLNDSVTGVVSKNEHPLMDDYSWLDGYQFSSAEGYDTKNSLNQFGHIYSHSSVNGNTSTGMMSFPFPGKQASTAPTQAVNQKMWPDYHLNEHLKLYQEQQQIQQGNQQSAPQPELYQGSSLWSGQFFV